MQRMKRHMNKVQALIIEKRNFGYWVVMMIALMMFANTELLSMIIPIWATYLINVALIVITTVYARLLVVALKELIKEKKSEEKTRLYAFLEQSFKDTDADVCNVDKNITNINNNIEEVRNILTESVTKLLETTDASLQAVQKENNDNIANQTKELIAKLDNILEENKCGSATNLEELRKTRDIITDKITDIDQANRVKEQEHYNSVEEKLNASDDKIMGEFTNIKELAKDMEEKRTEAVLTALDGVLSEVKRLLNEVETEISNAEKGNAELTEKLEKSISSELQNVGNALSKIEGTQKNNVVQIMELVDSKLLGLNQELVKQANSILDKSDENNDYVSEKYNRVFEQIRSVAKESKILINRVNDTIEENKNTIIQSQNAVNDSIGNHFQDVKNKEMELELLKGVVERNFQNISSELEITRGQLSSLNSLSALIKNLSEKRDDKVEKKQNRIETIEDLESGLLVKNEYKQDKLVTSQMFRGSKKVYEVLYGNTGEIVSTKNYNESGKVSIEMTYYPDGQVKERIEYTSGKAEYSKFDAKGNKIK